MKVNIIGAGNTGKTFARLIVDHNAGSIETVYNTTQKSNQAALRFISTGKGATSHQEIKPADLTLISTPDDLIESVCTELVKSKAIKPNSIVMHLSGLKSSDVLQAAFTLNCKILSAHPMKSFANPALAVNTFENTYCALEGNVAAIETITPLLQKIGAKPFTLKKEKKAVYHAAGVFASNYLVTLYHTAFECLTESGIKTNIAEDIVSSLMQSTLNNLKQLKSAKNALTGPLKRGDINTVREHLKQLNPNDRQLYKILAEKTLPLTEHEESLKLS